MKVYTKKSGHGHHIVDVFAEGENGAYFNIARCTTTNVEAVDSMNAKFLGSGGFYETQNDAKQALIDEAFEKGCVKTAMEEFNRTVKDEKKAILKGSAVGLLHAFKCQYDYRTFGIDEMSVDELLTEIAQAEVLGIDFVDNIDLTEAVLEWCGI
tara:strand:- start:2535 stop:2996 length:462 start_codon:yes stop_codon:yes gene_type:complete